MKNLLSQYVVDPIFGNMLYIYIYIYIYKYEFFFKKENNVYCINI